METEIRIDSIKELATYNVATFIGNRIAFINDLQSINTVGTVRTNIVLAILCLKGKGSIYINGEAQVMQAGDLLICFPNIILEKSMVSIDMEFRCICLSPEYIEQLIRIAPNWDLIKFFKKSPVISLDKEEVTIFCRYYDLLKSKLNRGVGRHQKEAADALLQALLYEFYDVLDRFVNCTPPSYSSGERLFMTFIRMLGASYPKPRTVAFYADRLNVTPKYLSAVCKRNSGNTASDLIDQYVVKDIQYLLKKTDKSIKEISNELDFPNLAFFGKYVKKHLGLSPKHYRQQFPAEEPEPV